MHSNLPKVLHRILGRPMIHFVLDALSFLPSKDVFIIIGHQADLVKKEMDGNFSLVLQSPQLGTGHALMQLEPIFGKSKGVLLVAPGDMPLLAQKHLEQLLALYQSKDYLAAVMAVSVEDPSSLGRVIRDKDGNLLRIVEESEASREELLIKEVCSSVYAFRLPELFSYLREIKPDNSQGEYFLTDILPLLVKDGEVGILSVADIPFVGVNDRWQLSQTQKELKKRFFSRLMKEGVTIEEPEAVWIDWDVKIGRDSLIRPLTVIEGQTVIGQSCVIGPFVWLKDAMIDDNSHISTNLERSSK